jgi:methylenetetrahydrofolate reductase (NADPH)
MTDMNATQTVSSVHNPADFALEARIAELVSSGTVEMSPRDADQISEAAALLPANMRVYVDSLPGRLHYSTLRAMEALCDEGLDPVPHVAARRIESREALKDFVAGAAHAGVRRVLLIGGDQPAPSGPYASSLDILQEGIFAEHGIKEVGFAGYPEGHTRISQALLDEALTDKVRVAQEQGLGVSVVTQFSFAPARIVEYCALMARKHPSLPVYVGMAGPTSMASLLRYAQRCGVSASLRAMSGMGVAAAKLVTRSDPMEQLAALARHCESGGTSNVVGSHLFSFGGFVQTSQFINRIISGASEA